jgi:hypothetical protein
MDDTVQKSCTVNIFDSLTRRLVREWHVLKNTSKNWDLKDSMVFASGMRSLQEELEGNWNVLQAELMTAFEDIREHLKSQEYAVSVEKEIKALNVPICGEFPQYELPPFKLSISLENFEAKLSLGRKSERTSVLNPQELAKWVSARYKKVSGRRFNSTAFMKDLLEAYRVSNCLIYREKDVAWGRAVPLLEIYDLLTLKQTSRQDYPKQFFMFDLGLLKEQSTISLEGFRFELGFARNQSRSIVIVDSLGREDRISSLTVYKEG